MAETQTETRLTLEELLQDNPDDAAAGITRLAGPCSACGRVGKPSGPDFIRNVLLLGFRVPEVEGEARVGGWGCAVCHLPCEGAVAFVCDPCLATNEPVRTFVLGDPRDGRRGLVEALTEPWAHDKAKHRELGC